MNAHISCLISHLEVVVAAGFDPKGRRIPQITEIYAKQQGLLVHHPDNA
jgi:hypothetical protein